MPSSAATRRATGSAAARPSVGDRRRPAAGPALEARARRAASPSSRSSPRRWSWAAPSDAATRRRCSCASAPRSGRRSACRATGPAPRCGSTSSPPGTLTAPGMHPRVYSSGVRESTSTMRSPRDRSVGQLARALISGVFSSACRARSPNTLLGTLIPCTSEYPAVRQPASPPSSTRTSVYPIAASVALASPASSPSVVAHHDRRSPSPSPAAPPETPPPAAARRSPERYAPARRAPAHARRAPHAGSRFRMSWVQIAAEILVVIRYFSVRSNVETDVHGDRGGGRGGWWRMVTTRSRPIATPASR